MKILLVSSSFYPEISPRSFRSTELAKEMYRQGHEVTVITKHRENDLQDFQIKYHMTFRMWTRNKFPTVPHFENKSLSFLARVLSRFLMLLFEYPGIEEMMKVKGMLKNEREYDLIISFAVPYPIHWGVAWARTKRNQIAKTWIADCGDPYMFSRLDRFKKPFYFKYLETKFCRKCDYITVPFSQMRNQFYPQFKLKIKVIPQGFNFKEIVLSQKPAVNDKLTFIFAGSIIPGKRDLTLFLNFLSTIPNEFYFIIYTNQKEWFNKYKAILGDKLIVNGYVDRLSLIYEMSKADFLVNVDSVLDTESNIEAVPSKLIDYALAKRPILSISSSCLDEEIVLQFIKKDFSNKRIIDLSVYDIQKVTKQFLELIDI